MASGASSADAASEARPRGTRASSGGGRAAARSAARPADGQRANGTFQIVAERVTAAFHYRSYRTRHYRTIGENTIGLSELSDYYRGILSEFTYKYISN